MKSIKHKYFNTSGLIDFMFKFFVLSFLLFSTFSCKSGKTLTQDQLTGILEQTQSPLYPCKVPIEMMLLESNDFPKEVIPSLSVEEKELFDGKIPEIGFREYVNKNITYPTETVVNKITACVFVGFIIEKDGSISNAKIIQGVNQQLDAEVLRIINESPAVWTPAKMRGKPIRSKYVFPIAFELVSE